ncbi:hypothetical protein VCHC57A1_2025, partial [Vibrio cholerae HC-57A1]
MAAEMAG